MTKNAAQLWDALKVNGTPRMFYFHQGGHGGAPTDFLTNLLVHEVPVGPGQRRREPAEVLGRARGGHVPAA